jgi:amino acid transporter
MIHNNLLAVNFKLEGPGIVPDLTNPAKPVENLISQIIGILTIVGAIFFIFQIIFAGYAMISSQGDPKKIEVARSRLTNGILGLTIVVVALGIGAFIATLLGIRDPLNIQNLIPKG